MQNEWKYVMQKFHLETLLYFCPVFVCQTSSSLCEHANHLSRTVYRSTRRLKEDILEKQISSVFFLRALV